MTRGGVPHDAPGATEARGRARDHSEENTGSSHDPIVVVWGRFTPAEARLARRLAKRHIALEVETVLGQVWLDAAIRAVQPMVGVSGRPAIEVVAEVHPSSDVSRDVPHGAVRYRLSEPLVAGQALGEQLRFLAQKMRVRERVTVRESSARRCTGCGHHVTEAYCGHCGERAHLPRPVLCTERAHRLWAGEVSFCPYCGDELTPPGKLKARFESL